MRIRQPFVHLSIHPLRESISKTDMEFPWTRYLGRFSKLLICMKATIRIHGDDTKTISTVCSIPDGAATWHSK